MAKKDLKRRTVLKQLGVSTAAFVGVSNGVAAKKSANSLKEKYSNKSDVKRAIATYANSLLKELAKRNILSKPSPEVFQLNSKLDRSRIPASEEIDGWAVTEYIKENGTHTAHILISKTTRKYSLTLHIQPQADKSYAFVYTKKTGEEFVIDASADRVKIPKTSSSDGDFSTTAIGQCNDYSYCSDTVCSVVERHGMNQYWHTKVYKDCTGTTSGCSCYTSGTYCTDLC